MVRLTLVYPNRAPGNNKRNASPRNAATEINAHLFISKKFSSESVLLPLLTVTVASWVWLSLAELLVVVLLVAEMKAFIMSKVAVLLALNTTVKVFVVKTIVFVGVDITCPDLLSVDTTALVAIDITMLVGVDITILVEVDATVLVDPATIVRVDGGWVNSATVIADVWANKVDVGINPSAVVEVKPIAAAIEFSTIVVVGVGTTTVGAVDNIMLLGSKPAEASTITSVLVASIPVVKVVSITDEEGFWIAVVLVSVRVEVGLVVVSIFALEVVVDTWLAVLEWVERC